MELYSVYRVVFLFALISTDGYVSARVFIAAAAVAGAVWLALFILQGVGLYKMAKMSDSKTNGWHLCLLRICFSWENFRAPVKYSAGK